VFSNIRQAIAGLARKLTGGWLALLGLWFEREFLAPHRGHVSNCGRSKRGVDEPLNTIALP